VSRTTRRTRRSLWLAWAAVGVAFAVLCFALGYTEAGYVTLAACLVAPLAGKFGAYLALRGTRGSD
jgi:hypothetical protein